MIIFAVTSSRFRVGDSALMLPRAGHTYMSVVLSPISCVTYFRNISTMARGRARRDRGQRINTDLGCFLFPTSPDLCADNIPLQRLSETFGLKKCCRAAFLSLKMWRKDDDKEKHIKNEIYIHFGTGRHVTAVPRMDAQGLLWF